MNPIGIMQGRLSPPADGRIQSFPVASWRDEFERARDAGLERIEWIYEAGTDASNPLGTDEGLAEIRRLADASGVAVRSVCADYFMADRLLAEDGQPRPGAVERLLWLIDRAGAAALDYIILPFVDPSSLRQTQASDGLVDVLRRALVRAERYRVELHLETDLAPPAVARVVADVGHPLVRVNLDIGNSASLGHDPNSEMRDIGPVLGSVHIKDRVRGGGTVPLGTGSADFETYFRHFGRLHYHGPFILQVARSNDEGEVEWARRNRRYVANAVGAWALDTAERP